MKKLCKRWTRKGRATCFIGIGLNTGEMVADNIGCETMTSYTVLGDNVNLGARLCSVAKPEQIIVPESTYQVTKKHFKVNRLDPIFVKGKAKPINIYEVAY